MRSVLIRLTLRSWAWPATPSLTDPDSATPAEDLTSRTSTRNCQELKFLLAESIIRVIRHFDHVRMLFVETRKFIVFLRHASNEAEVHQGL